MVQWPAYKLSMALLSTLGLDGVPLYQRIKQIAARRKRKQNPKKKKQKITKHYVCCLLAIVCIWKTIYSTVMMRLIQLRNELNKMKMGYARPDTQFENELCAPAKFKRDFIKSTVSCVGLHKCFVKGMLRPATMQQYSYPKHEIRVEPTDFDLKNRFLHSRFRLRVFSSLYGCMGSLCSFIKDLFQRAMRHNWLSQR